MKKLASQFVVILFVLGLGLGINQANAADLPDVMVKNATNEILSILKKNKKLYEKDSAALYKMVHIQLAPYFDFQTMSKLVLGINWRNANSDQRTRFANAFRDLLVRTYAKVMLRYTNEKILYLPYRGKPTDKKSTVKTKVISKSGAPDIPIHYSFFNKNNVWKVFDVSVEGISLINNYRSVYVYREKVKKQGLESVIKMIQKDPGKTESDKAKKK
jgi:phospholipid transport system substrate-binding protein